MHNPTSVYLNRVETAVPEHDGHAKFIEFLPRLLRDERKLKIIQRLASRCHIDRRFSVLRPSPSAERLDDEGFYEIGQFASTEKRMERYRKEALPLAEKPVARLFEKINPESITHLIVTSCTGFYAPGLDLELQQRFAMRSDLERTVIGFMGCYAGITGLRAAWQAVRSNPEARVLMVNLELCSLHLQDTTEIEKVLGMLQFGDGCAASLISADEFGLRVDRFRSEVFPTGEGLIRWTVRDRGFDMHLSTDVPQALGQSLPEVIGKVMSDYQRSSTRLWAIHPGGRSILDTVQEKLQLSDDDMRVSREVLRNYGNMSSATVMFVLKSILEDNALQGHGAALAFGPGLTVESMLFHKRPL